MMFPRVDPAYVLRLQDIPTEDWEYFSKANASIDVDTPLQQGDRVRITTRQREVIDGTWLTIFVNYFEGVGITIRTSRGDVSLSGCDVLAIEKLEDAPLMGANIPMRDHHRDTVALRGDDDE